MYNAHRVVEMEHCANWNKWAHFRVTSIYDYRSKKKSSQCANKIKYYNDCTHLFCMMLIFRFCSAMLVYLHERCCLPILIVH